MNAKQRREAVEHFRCPHCSAQGAGFYYQEATITDWTYDPKKGRFKPAMPQAASELLGEQPEFDGQYAIRCRNCSNGFMNAIGPFDADSFRDFVDSITEAYLEEMAEKELAEELRVQTEIGMVQPGLRQLVQKLKEKQGN
jgi:hypothetical protein